MKYLLLLCCIVALGTPKTSAQIGMPADRVTVAKYEGKYIYVYGIARSIKVANATLAYLKLRAYGEKNSITIILSGKGASKRALFLKGKVVSFTSRVKIISGEPTLTVHNFKQIGSGPGCLCLAGDPNPTIIVDTVRH